MINEQTLKKTSSEADNLATKSEILLNVYQSLTANNLTTLDRFEKIYDDLKFSTLHLLCCLENINETNDNDPIVLDCVDNTKFKLDKSNIIDLYINKQIMFSLPANEEIFNKVYFYFHTSSLENITCKFSLLQQIVLQQLLHQKIVVNPQIIINFIASKDTFLEIKLDKGEC